MAEELEEEKAKKLEHMTSRGYIAQFAALDRKPLETGPERDRQIVALVKRLLPVATRNATPEQILRLHQGYLSGLY